MDRRTPNGVHASISGRRPAKDTRSRRLRGTVRLYASLLPEVKAFMTKFREAFPDARVAPAVDFVAEGDYVVGRWVGSGTHTGSAYCDFLVGCLPAGSRHHMRFTGTTVLRLQNGQIAEQIGLDDEVAALLQLCLTGVS